MSCNKSYSRGATEGSRAQAELALLVDQARVWAEPQATFVIFFTFACLKISILIILSLSKSYKYFFQSQFVTF